MVVIGYSVLRRCACPLLSLVTTVRVSPSGTGHPVPRGVPQGSSTRSGVNRNLSSRRRSLELHIPWSCSGGKASRPELDRVLALMGKGDMLKIADQISLECWKYMR
jgi:hypothetical protein